MTLSRRIPVRQQALALSLPQVQGFATDAEFFGPPADILAMLHPLYGILLESHPVAV